MKTTYSIEALADGSWRVIRNEIELRQGAISEARRLAQLSHVTHHVYMLTKSGKRKHVFAARVAEVFA